MADTEEVRRDAAPLYTITFEEAALRIAILSGFSIDEARARLRAAVSGLCRPMTENTLLSDQEAT